MRNPAKSKNPAHKPRPAKYSQRGRGAAGLKIISGGQTGADRAALDFALGHDIPHGGWCPKGRRAEDGRIPRRYHLRETPSPAYRQRTRLNVESADVTVLLGVRPFVGGSALTEQLCKRKHKPLLVLSPGMGLSRAAHALRHFLRTTQAKVVNIAGPRISTLPSIYPFTLALLERALLERSFVKPVRKLRKA